MPGVFGSAEFSTCMKYRYELTRSWDATLPTVAFIMLNPSTADAADDDNTIRKCMGFAKRWGMGGLRVYNLFAFRATDPEELVWSEDPTGPDNDRWIQKAKEAGVIVCAWGSTRVHRLDVDLRETRARAVCEMMRGGGTSLKVLILNSDGHPRHPLYLKNNTLVKAWAGLC